VANLVLLGVGWIDKALYVDFAKWIAGLYFAGNVGAAAAELLKAKQ
jgi:hypothetical protein